MAIRQGLIRIGTNKYVNVSGPEWIPAALAIPLCYFLGWIVRQIYNKWFSSALRAKLGDGALFWTLLGVGFLIQKMTGNSALPHSIYSAVGVLFSVKDAIRFGANLDAADLGAETINANSSVVVDVSAMKALADLVVAPINQKFLQDGITQPGTNAVLEIDGKELVPFIQRGMANGILMAVE